MKIEALVFLSYSPLIGIFHAQERKTLAYSLIIIYNINKPDPRRQYRGLFEQIQYKF
ncbi:hypothetical protein [Olivibacter ginsenosidimutans]|uniref:hypothetical protein n=1 Tax=Olivibacter ginsenosidimutans TaxID=1176537 RepID=UPI0031E55DC9